jgi:nucleotide-binding universal stress UspA family protein
MSADSTILVGVSGSAASLSALRWAADEAERRECRLRVVLVWQRDLGASYAQQADRRDTTRIREQAWSVLTEAVCAELGPGPWRSTTIQAVEGRAEQVLVAASEDAELLVLGSGQAALIGPVVRTCLTNAHCPVLVVSQQVRPTRLRLTPPAAAPVSRRAVAAASR